jgi:hypothetical protein
MELTLKDGSSAADPRSKRVAPVETTDRHVMSISSMSQPERSATDPRRSYDANRDQLPRRAEFADPHKSADCGPEDPREEDCSKDCGKQCATDSPIGSSLFILLLRHAFVCRTTILIGSSFAGAGDLSLPAGGYETSDRFACHFLQIACLFLQFIRHLPEHADAVSLLICVHPLTQEERAQFDLQCW